MKYIPGLNGLRALAVSFVVFYHWTPPSFFGLDILMKVLPDGRFGVNLFFVLSGFLISSILFIEKGKISDSYTPKQIIRKFYIRRLLRIFPIYYLTLLLVYFLEAPDFNQNLIYYFSYTENFHLVLRKAGDFFMHAWSLSVEEQFYLFWPLIILFLDRGKILKVLVFFIFLAPIFSFIQSAYFHNYWFFLTPSCLDGFGMGALVAYYYTEDNLQALKKGVKMVLPIVILFYVYWQVEPMGHFQYLIRFFDSIISAAAILFCLSHRYHAFINLFLENRVMRSIGMISYGIYLFHYPLPYFFHRIKSNAGYSEHIDNSFAEYGSMVLILLAISFFSWYFFEKPVLSLKNRIP
jgi:peptidoglycan/LPS O-acetylase OafA/YrhL